MRPGRLLGELQRRHVLRVVGAYAFAAWVAVEVYTTIQPILFEAHEWTNRMVVILALLGFPVVFALAWIFDITPEGVKRTVSLDDVGVEATSAAASAPARHRRLTPRAAGFFGLGILVALVSFAAYAGTHYQPGDARVPDATAQITSMAVLPFEDLSAAQDQEFFSDGITEELLNRLSQVPELHVPGRTSSFALKDERDLREIGRRLGVKAVLEGTVRRDRDRVRVTTKLIDVGTGYQLWSETFEGDATHVFALQDSIASSIIAALRQRFAPAPEAGQRGTQNARAHELYLLGLRSWNMRTDRELRRALVYFQSAVQEDPQFATAYAGLAQTYAVLPVYGDFPVDTAVMRGTAAAAQAIALDPSLADAYAAMGQIIQNFEWDLRGAERYYQRALGYAPNSATAHQWYAETLMLLGRHAEAQTHADRVLAIDPLSPTALYVDAYVRMLRGSSDEALATWRDLVRLHPDYELGVLHHALAAVAGGRAEEATRSLHRLGVLQPARAPTYDAIAAALPDPSARPRAVAALHRAAGIAPSERAGWFMALGDRAAALAALQHGYAAHSDVNLAFMLVHPLLVPLRTDAQFRTIAAELELGF